MAVEDAAAAAAAVSLAKAAPLRPLNRSLAAVALLWAAAGALAVCLPGLALDAMGPLPSPLRRRPAVLASKFEITPGNVSRALRQRIGDSRRRPRRPVEQLELVLESAHGREPPLPMFQEADGAWRAVLAKVVEPADYFVRAYRARSSK